MRPQWPEYPSPLFLLTGGLVLLNLLLAVSGLCGAWNGNRDVDDLVLQPPQTASDFIGRTPSAVRTLLGAPTLVRHEPPAEIWQYRKTDCVLDIYVYHDSTPARIQHAEIRGRSGRQTPTPDSSCLHSFTLAVAN